MKRTPNSDNSSYIVVIVCLAVVLLSAVFCRFVRRKQQSVLPITDIETKR